MSARSVTRVLQRTVRFAGWSLFALIAVTNCAARAEEPVKPNTFDLVLVSFENKNQAIKAVHDIAAISLTDSKALVEKVPAAILAGVTKDEAEKAAKHA